MKADFGPFPWLLILPLFCGIVYAEPISYSEAVLSDNPVAYWRFNETDTAGGLVDHADDPATQAGSQNGNFTGEPIFGEPGALLSDDDPAVRWNPNDDSGQDYATVTGLPISDSFTVELWGKSATEKWNVFGWLASAREANGFIVHPDEDRYGNTGTSWDGYVHDSSGNHHSIAEHEFSTSDLDIQDWHHYVITFDDASDTGRMYLDGRMVGEDTSMTFSRDATGTINLLLGRDKNNGRYGDGWLDEVAVYLEPLTETQIQTHYQASLPEPTSSLLLVLGWLLLCLQSRRGAGRHR